jgi:hypothetical protein
LFLSQGDVVDTQHFRTALFTIVGEGMQQVKQRIRADGHADFARQASTTVTASLECEGGQQLGCAVSAPSVVGKHAVEALGEDLTWAVWYIAEPPSAMNSQPHRVAAPRQVERTPQIAAVLALTQFPALWARDSLARRFGNQHEAPIELNDDKDDLPVL